MRTKHFIYSLPISLTALLVGVSEAKAAYFSPMNNHTAEDIEAQIRDGSFVEEFNASSYIGDNGDAAHELEIVDINPPAEVVNQEKGQYLWGNSEEVEFELSLDKDNNLTYKVGDTIIQSTNVSEGGFDINGMILSTTSTEDSSVTLKNLMFDDGDMNRYEMFSSDSDADFLKVTGIDNTFTLTGKQVFNWDGERPADYDLAYKIRVGTFQDPMAAGLAQTEIPEPGTVSLFSLGIIALGLKCRRSQK